MKTEDISAKRQLLARKNYGRRQMSGFLDRLSFALSQKLEAGDLLSLEETDSLYGRYTELLKAAIDGNGTAYLQTWPPEDKDALELKLNCFRDNVTDNKVILFSRGFDHCGALRAPLNKVLDHVFELLLVDGDSMRLLDENKTNGMCVDVYEDHELGDEIYELVVWGNDWVSAINKC
jgi:hypothetical protein